MEKTDLEQVMLREFAEFIEAELIAPSKKVDEAVLREVAKDLCPAAWKVFTKLTLVEVAAGLFTLAFCPQFGLGVATHNPFLHELPAGISPAVFYFICGMLFVSLGAALGGLVLKRQEIRAVSPTRNRYFVGYSLLAYVVLVALGPEVFVASSLTWVVGALLGNVLGYGAIIGLRQALLWS
jgi:hypothetical protein